MVNGTTAERTADSQRERFVKYIEKTTNWSLATFWLLDYKNNFFSLPFFLAVQLLPARIYICDYFREKVWDINSWPCFNCVRATTLQTTQDEADKQIKQSFQNMSSTAFSDAKCIFQNANFSTDHTTEIWLFNCWCCMGRLGNGFLLPSASSLKAEPTACWLQIHIKQTNTTER